jgi:cytochrome P450
MTINYFNPHSNDWLLNKFSFYEEIRNNERAYWSDKYKSFIITRYSDVLYVLNNSDIFSSAKGNLVVENTSRFGNTLGASDDPLHSLFKNIVKNAYSKNNLLRIESLFVEKAKELFKKELNISLISEDLSAWVVTEIINLPFDKEKIKNLILGIQKHAMQSVLENIDQKYYDEFLDILTDCIINKIEPTGPGIYQEYMHNVPKNFNVLSLFTGPTLSGAGSLTSALQYLTLDACDSVGELLSSPSLIPNAVNESLRLHASTGRFSRTVTQNVLLHGINLKAGDRVIVCLDSANRDPLMFENPNKFLISRDTNKNLAFGHGTHACIALAISKSLMACYLKILIEEVGYYKIVNKNFEFVMTQSGNNDMITNLIIGPIDQ